jgi:outer membrane protein TolC
MKAGMVRSATAVMLAALLLGSPALAQQAQAPAGDFTRSVGMRKYDFSKGNSHLFTVFKPYMPMPVAPAEITNAPSLEKMISDGKLMLSLEDAISLALENNLDISVQRYGPWIADTAVLRAKAGQGTAAGSFDPTLTSLFAWDRRSIPINNPFLAGGGLTQTALTNYTTNANFGYTQGFPTGTAYQITWNNTRSSTTSASTFLNPSVQSTMNFSFQQPLLEGLGFASNKRFLRLARNNKRLADLSFQDQVINTVSAVQNLYWDLVFAREDVKVKQRSVELAEKLYNDNRRQVEIGTLAPIEVVRAEAEVARTRQDLIVSQTFLLQQQTLMKNALTKNSMHPSVLTVEVVPTDSISKPRSLPSVSLPDAVNEAWEKRPDIRQARIDLENRHITVRSTRNALLPTLTLFGQFGGTGLAGDNLATTTTPTGTFRAITTSPLVDAAGNPILIGGQPVFASALNTTSVTTLTKAGWDEALARVRNFDFPNYSVRFDLNIPIRNRAAQADNAQAQLEERQSETRLRQLQNNIVVQVRNAQIALEQNQARVDAAQKSRELQERTLDAEQKKYQLGASTIFFVIQAQRDLAAAQSAEVNALAQLLKARVEFDRALGRTLESSRISMADAMSGQPSKETLIPGRIVAAPASPSGFSTSSQKF